MSSNNQGHQDQDAVFGSTGGAHAGLMGAIWGPALNISIFLALYSYRRYAIIIHGIFGVAACAYSLGTSIPILTFTGILGADTTISTQYSGITLNRHYIVGIVCLSVITVETILGITTRLSNIFQVKSTIVMAFRKIHTIFGYIIAILCKAQIYIITSGGGFAAFLAQDIIFLILLIIRKLKFPLIESRINLNHLDILVSRMVKSIKEIEGKELVVFSNYVYDLKPLKIEHPAGFQIVESVKNREIDRFIYGMYSSELMPNIDSYSHTFKSLALLGNPIAKIGITSTYGGFIKDQVEVRISSLKQISQEGRIYEMLLMSKEQPFVYQKYTEICQLGRYYSLSVDEKFTRLYTSVNFLQADNKLLMEKYFQIAPQQRIIKRQEDNGKSSETLIKNDFQMEFRPDNKNTIPILFKEYPEGKVTHPLSLFKVSKLVLSCPKGEGLQMQHLKKGKVLIVAGGTGLYPFSDLIDLLFKEKLVRQRTQLQQEVFALSPLLRDKSFDQFRFQLLAAFNSLQDIHPITFKQILSLSLDRLKVTFKIKIPFNKALLRGSNIKIVQESFQRLLAYEIEQEKELSKIWICGPPKMNEGVIQFLKDKVSPDLYLMI